MLGLEVIFDIKHSWDRKRWESLLVVKINEGEMKNKKKTIDKVRKENQNFGYVGRDTMVKKKKKFVEEIEAFCRLYKINMEWEKKNINKKIVEEKSWLVLEEK